MSTAGKMIDSTLDLTPRVQKGLKLVEEGRIHKKPSWEVGLTILDEETAKLPLVQRKALAGNKVLCEMPVTIREHELLVGDAIQNNSVATTGVWFPAYATGEERQRAVEKLTGTGSTFGHFSPSYPKYLRLGLSGLRELAEDKLGEVKQEGTKPDREAWYEAVILALDGLRVFIGRYRNLASNLADNESDSRRKGELQKISMVSQHLMERPPQTFHEALQAVWFLNAAIQSLGEFSPLGRFDQYLWPYLERDLEKGAITLDEAQELIDCLWLKFNDRLQTWNLVKGSVMDMLGLAQSTVDTISLEEIVATIIGAWGAFMGGRTSADRLYPLKGSEYTLWLQTVTLAGLTPEGIDGTNPLTYLCINATFRTRLPQPSLYVRFHDASPAELYKRVADSIRAGLAQPAIYNDEVIVPALEKQGIPVEHARDYTSDGCWEVHVQGRTQFKYGLISAPEALDRALCPGRFDEQELPTHYDDYPLPPLTYMEEFDPFRDAEVSDPRRFSTFDEVMESFKAQLDRYIKGFVEIADSMWDGRLYDISPLPLMSALTEGPLESGKDITQGGIEYVFHAPLLAGLSHAADSLAAIKKLCFVDRVVEWPELLDAVNNNWEGKEHLRQLVRTRVPAYGNDVDYVDEMAREIVDFYVALVRKYGARAKSKTKFTPGIGTFQYYITLGLALSATPDGRLAQEPVSSNASPSLGRAVNRQTAVLNSYLKLPHTDLPIGAPLDLAMDAGAQLLLLEPLIKSFVERRGSVLTIGVTDCEKLRAALREPEKYRDLKVRVGGWEAYFVDLPPHYQQWQLQKYEQYRP